MDKENENTNVDRKMLRVRMTVNPEENAHFRFSKAPILYKRYIAINKQSFLHGAVLQLQQAITASIHHESTHYDQYTDTLRNHKQLLHAVPAPFLHEYRFRMEESYAA